jgi:hypothetical protein
MQMVRIGITPLLDVLTFGLTTNHDKAAIDLFDLSLLL